MALMAMLVLFSQVFRSVADAPAFPAGVSYIDYLTPAMLAVTTAGLGEWPNRWHAVWGLGAFLTGAGFLHLLGWLAASFGGSSPRVEPPPPA